MTLPYGSGSGVLRDIVTSPTPTSSSTSSPQSHHSPPHVTSSATSLLEPSLAMGKISGAYRSPTDTYVWGRPWGQGDSADSYDAGQGGWFRMFSVAAYKPYFDVDTFGVVERI
ncbi:hypothetical protein GUJ93_ZPchr0002g24295 [Zizania palustris]|uniref:Uncharacterized protein n=1 Tax=Zizania palustris TaxID=103762 RepID=A0A8J5S8K1_ZIZPA|nr:hypothetical protein GUJ93_ZPchr0002g24295 [Zizania palustris]